MKHFLIFATLVFFAMSIPLRAIFAESNELEVIQNAIKEKQGELSGVHNRIAELEKELKNIQKRARTLETQMAVLENRLAKIALDMEATRLKKAALVNELALIEEQLEQLSVQEASEKASLRSVLRALQSADQQNRLYLVVQTKTFSEFFNRVRQYEELNRRLKDTLEKTRVLANETATYKEGRAERLAEVQKLADELSRQQELLEDEEAGKQVLVLETRQSEDRYQNLIAELEEEQRSIANQIAALQGDIEARLRGQEGGSLDGSLTWPLAPSNKRITALFRDPTYPFRYLFEHSGLDIAAPQGSEVRAAAPGVVAWTRQGRQYGNYLMIIHTDGVATLYAHLSAFEVVPDQFVARGQVVARSGGARGNKGAGLSTGPHLHFEVRKGGIPVDPAPFFNL